MGIKASEIAGVLSQGSQMSAHKAPKYAVDAASQHVGTPIDTLYVDAAKIKTAHESLSEAGGRFHAVAGWPKTVGCLDT